MESLVLERRRPGLDSAGKWSQVSFLQDWGRTLTPVMGTNWLEQRPWLPFAKAGFLHMLVAEWKEMC